MKSVFVTGASGFAGSVVLEHLRRQGYEVIAGVRNRARKLALEQRFIKALVCDVADPISVARVIAAVKPDGVIHLAGVSRPATAADEPLTAYQSIVTSWANVCDAVRRATPRSKVLLVSACDVYGNSGRDGRALAEDAPLEPVSTFGALKATAESIAQTFHRKYHLDVTIARPFHHTGPRQSGDFFFGAVAQRLAAWDANSDGTTLALPDLECRRDLLHVADVAEAYEALLLNGAPNGIYNVSSGVALTCRELVEHMARISRANVTVQALPPRDKDEEYIPVFRGSNEKICQETGWQPTRDAVQAVTELAYYYQSQVQTR